jgi:hypothetical protein
LNYAIICLKVIIMRALAHYTFVSSVHERDKQIIKIKSKNFV